MEHFRLGMENELWFNLIHKDPPGPLSVGDPRVPVADVLDHFARDLSESTLKTKFPHLMIVEIGSCFCAAAELRNVDEPSAFPRTQKIMRSLSRDLSLAGVRRLYPDLTDEKLRAELRAAADHFRHAT